MDQFPTMKVLDLMVDLAETFQEEMQESDCTHSRFQARSDCVALAVRHNPPGIPAIHICIGPGLHELKLGNLSVRIRLVNSTPAVTPIKSASRSRDPEEHPERIGHGKPLQKPSIFVKSPQQPHNAFHIRRWYVGMLHSFAKI